MKKLALILLFLNIYLLSQATTVKKISDIPVIYCNNGKTIILTFPEKIKTYRLSNQSLFKNNITQENNSLLLTPNSAQIDEDISVFTEGIGGIELVYHYMILSVELIKNNPANYGISQATANKLEGVVIFSPSSAEVKEKYEQTYGKDVIKNVNFYSNLIQKQGYDNQLKFFLDKFKKDIKNYSYREYKSKGIIVSIKEYFIYNNKMYFIFDIYNHSRQNYKLEYAGLKSITYNKNWFGLNSSVKSNDNYIISYTIKPEKEIKKGEKATIVLITNKFSIDSKTYLKHFISEVDGNRDLEVIFKVKDLIKSLN